MAQNQMAYGLRNMGQIQTHSIRIHRSAHTSRDFELLNSDFSLLCYYQAVKACTRE